MPPTRLLDAQVEPTSAGSVPADLAAIPRDILDEATRRLQIACLVWVALATVGLIMNVVVGPLVIGRPLMPGRWPWPGWAIVPAIIAVSLGFFAYLRRHQSDSERALNLGLAYQVILALAIGIINQWIPASDFHGLSFIVMLILVQSVIVPNTPRRILITSLICALMDPVGAAIAKARGVPGPSLVTTLLISTPNFLAAVIAVLQARIFGRLGRQVGKARELGSYALGELIGRGGMGEVWRANHRLLARPAAIKLISAQKLVSADADDARLLVQRFRREAQAASQLQSPHTINLFDFGVAADGSFYLVMELLQGMDLETMVRRFGPMPAVRAVHLLTQVCHSLAEAHAAGMVHRDIKPANLFLCRLGLDVDHIKVLDFGLAKWVAEKAPQSTVLTAPDVPTGTPAYMAPETAMGEPVDHRADIYALGCVGYWLLTGKLVFPAESALQAIVKHVNEAPRPPSQVSELPVPAALDRVILACLEKRPDQRPPDACTLRRMLENAVSGEPWAEDRARQWWQQHLPPPAAPVAHRL